ncbi:MAG: hypothetical protein QW238_05705 [Candidatus Bathyarchaeia archaeon]
MTLTASPFKPSTRELIYLKVNYVKLFRGCLNSARGWDATTLSAAGTILFGPLTREEHLRFLNSLGQFTVNLLLDESPIEFL